MCRIASVSLFLAYIFLLKFISISQVGTDWEVPYAIIKKSKMMLVIGALFIIISCILALMSHKSLKKYRRITKVIYIYMLLIAVGIIGLGFSGIFYRLPVGFPLLSEIMKYIFWPGLAILLFFMILLFVAN